MMRAKSTAANGMPPHCWCEHENSIVNAATHWGLRSEINM